MADFSSLLGAAGIGGAIGKAIVSLELETTKYQAELKAAQTQTAAGTTTMGSNVSKFGGLAQSAFLGAGFAAVAFGAYAVNAAIESEEALAKLDNTLENNAKLSDVSRQSFIDLADSLRELTGVDDEAIISAEALLGQFKLSGREVQELIPLIVDLSAKMGIDLEAAAKAVGRATTGSAGALARYGIKLDETALQSDAFGAVTSGLEGTVGGFAAEVAKDQPWKIFMSNIEEAAEGLGLALLPILKVITDFLNTFMIPALAAVAEGLALAFSAETYTDIPVIGEVFKGLGVGIQHVGFALNQTSDAARGTKDELDAVAAAGPNMAAGIAVPTNQASRLAEELDRARHASRTFAHMSGDELKEWSKETTESFREVILGFEDVSSESDITSRDLRRGFREMREDAIEFRNAMRELGRTSNEWVPEDFRKYLAELGPDALIAFADTNKQQQKRLVEDWRASEQAFKDSLGSSFVDLNDKLDKLDNKTTKHTVEFHYKYVDFDPDMPGMQRTGAGGETAGRRS